MKENVWIPEELTDHTLVLQDVPELGVGCVVPADRLQELVRNKRIDPCVITENKFIVLKEK